MFILEYKCFRLQLNLFMVIHFNILLTLFENSTILVYGNLKKTYNLKRKFNVDSQ